MANLVEKSILVYLSRILTHLEKNNKIKDIAYKHLNLTHILFADNILIFVEDNDVYIINLQCAIHLFEEAVGLNINPSKSAISPINVSKERAKFVARCWDIKTHFLPINYFGMPLR